nr:hypothetical protein [Pandoravirus massiliensis]
MANTQQATGPTPPAASAAGARSLPASSVKRPPLGTLSSRSMPPAAHRACTRAHVESAQRAWTESGPLGTLARARLADIVARVSTWPDTVTPLCEAPLPGNARPDVARYPYTVALTGVSRKADAETSFGAGVTPTHNGASEPATRGRIYEAACEALWHYVRVVLPELEVYPRCPGADVYDVPDRLRLAAYRRVPSSVAPCDTDDKDTGDDGGIYLAYGFATAWEAGALERAAAFLAARRKRRAAQSPRPLARTGWLSTRSVKPEAIRAAGGGGARNGITPHPRLMRDRSIPSQRLVPHHFDDDDDGDDDDDDNNRGEDDGNAGDGGFYVDVHGRLSTRKRTSKDDSHVARERDPYSIRNPPALWWHQRPSRADPMEIEDRDRERTGTLRLRRVTWSREDSETDIDPTDGDDDTGCLDAIDGL